MTNKKWASAFICSFAGIYLLNLILRYVRRGWGISVCQIVGIVIKNAGDIWLIAFRTKNCYAVRGMHAVQGRYILAGEAEHQPGRIVESSLHIVYKAGKIFCAVNVAENTVGA